MMKKATFYFLVLTLSLIACTSDEDIIRLMKSQNSEDVYEGIMLSARTKDKKFVPLLLENPEDIRISNLSGRGQNLYQGKMDALAKIFDVNPPKQISYAPDTAIINFYRRLYEQEK